MLPSLQNIGVSKMESSRPEQLIPNMNGVADFILLRAEKAKLEAKA